MICCNDIIGIIVYKFDIIYLLIIFILRFLKILINNYKFMQKNEDLWTEKTVPIEETTKTEETKENVSENKEEIPKIEEIKENVSENNEETPKMDDFSELDAIINELMASEKVTEPKNFISEPKKEEIQNPKKENEDEFITEEEIKEMEENFKEIEIELENKNIELEKINSELDEMKSKLDNQTILANWYEEALNKLWEHPILWPLNMKIIKWEELDIPWYLMKSIEEDLNSMPNIDKTVQIPTKETPKLSAQDKILRATGRMY